MVQGMDRKQREEFDSTLNTGVGAGAWDRIEGQAWERLEAGDFDRGTDLGEPGDRVKDVGDQ